jgi:prepilin-type N-terminal cleavage/methylation domain-containing protein
MIASSTPQHGRHGFSLLELSVVIGIIALIAGVGMTMATGALKAADRVTTQERLNTIKLALDSFGKTYGYLPCPADRTQLPAAATYGTAAATCGAAGAGFEVTSGVAFGALPVRTLGLPDSYAGDAWGNKLSYGVTTALTPDPTRMSTRAGAVNIRFGSSGTNYNVGMQRSLTTYSNPVDNGGGLARIDVASSSGLVAGAAGTMVHIRSNNPSTGLFGSYNITTILAGPKIDLTGSAYIGGYAGDTGTIEWLEPGTSAAYVVISHGPDGRGAYPVAGTAVPALKKCNDDATANSSPPPCTSSANTNCRDIENCQTGGAFNGNFYDTTYNDGTNDTVYFDDYVVWGSNALQRIPVNPVIYTSTTTSNCPSGTCEAWCAACVVNYPGAGATAPPTGILNHATFPAIALCKKVVTSNAGDCKASCFWSGQDNSGTPNHYKCP